MLRKAEPCQWDPLYIPPFNLNIRVQQKEMLPGVFFKD